MTPKFLRKEQLNGECYKVKYLGGLWSLKFDLKDCIIQYRLLGLKVIKAKFNSGSIIYKILGLLPIKTRFGVKKFLLEILAKYLKQKTDLTERDVVGLFNRSGETFFIFRHMDKFLQKNNIKNPIFISPTPYLNDIVKMYQNDYTFINVPLAFFELHFHSNKKEPLTPTSNFFEVLNDAHFYELENAVQKGENKYFITEIYKRMGIDTISPQEASISPEAIISAETKLARLNIKDKFIFIAPDAKSNGTMSNQFWEKLAIQLYNSGYDILYNSLPKKQQNSFDKYCFLTLEEARYIAQKASCVIGVRSGLLDVITSPNTKIQCIYLPFLERGKLRPMSAQKVMDTFSLKKLPNVNPYNIIEYDGEQITPNQLLNGIMNKLKEI